MRKSIRFAVAALLQLSAAVAIAHTRSLGPPWQHRDIGDVGAPGGVSAYDDGEIAT